MRIIIQCADSKVSEAGFFRTPSGTPVSFVARPGEAPRASSLTTFARPDDAMPGAGRSWRDLLLAYNAANLNPFELTPAARLYRHHAYSDLVAHHGLERVYILSAGWGLVRGDFLLPRYDITFSSAAESYKRRRQGELWSDFRHLEDGDDPIFFFGGKDYLPLFCRLTSGFKARRTVYYRSEVPPDAPGCHLVRHETTTRTNWHYECVARFLARG